MTPYSIAGRRSKCSRRLAADSERGSGFEPKRARLPRERSHICTIHYCLPHGELDYLCSISRRRDLADRLRRRGLPINAALARRSDRRRARPRYEQGCPARSEPGNLILVLEADRREPESSCSTLTGCAHDPSTARMRSKLVHGDNSAVDGGEATPTSTVAVVQRHVPYISPAPLEAAGRSPCRRIRFGSGS